jgi:hypothetical protein
MWFYNFLLPLSYESWFSVYVFTMLPIYAAWRFWGRRRIFETLRNCCNLAAALSVVPITFVYIMSEHPPHSVGYIAYQLKNWDVYHFYDNIDTYYIWLPALFWIFFIRPCRKSWAVSLVVCVLCNPFFDLDQFVVKVFHLTGFNVNPTFSMEMIQIYLGRVLIFWGLLGFIFGLHFLLKKEREEKYL